MENSTEEVQDQIEQPGQPASEDQTELLKRLREEIKLDKAHHKDAFARMREDMYVATWGRPKDWDKTKYTANITGRHVKQKTAALYAKNPKIVAKRRDTLDFALWDETPESLQMALQMQQQMMQQEQAMAGQPPQIDPMTGQPIPPPMPPGAEEAMALMEDIGQGMKRRNEIKRFGKTLELLWDYFSKEQKPLDFKSGMKKLVRRACTTGVGYIELGFQRENGPRPDLSDNLADARTRLDHIKSLMMQVEEGGEGDRDNLEADIQELALTVAALQAEPEIVLREGIVFDYPLSTKVIPDRLCKSLVGFVGARHITVELMYTKAQVRDMFDVDLKDKATVFKISGDGEAEEPVPYMGENTATNTRDNDLVCVQKFYDKVSGLVYILCDGYDQFLREPAAPDVFVEDFWPVYALTFNDVENEDELYPPSDVRLLLDFQREYNRARQGMREHRDAAKPRWAAPQGALAEPDIAKLSSAQPFEVVILSGMGPGQKVTDLLQSIPMPGVDPNLYETGQLFTDAQLVAGTQEAQLGGTSNSTATESRIAADSSQSADGAAIDDLDAFLTRVARGAGQVMMKEMSADKVMEIVGPGAVWPEASLAEIANELSLEIEAGSTGKPNQAVEIRNWREMLPNLMQIPGINPNWLARETLRRLDDRMDLTEAITANVPSIVAINNMQRAGPQNPMADPNAQGDNGGANAAPLPGGQAGSDPGMGDNQDPVMGAGSTGAAPVF